MRAHCLPACRCERAKLFPPARAPALTHPARLASAARHHPGQPPAPSGQPLWSTSLTIPSCLPRCRWRPVPSPPPQRSHPLRAPKPPRPPQPPRPPRPPQPQPSVLTSCKARNDVHFAPCQDVGAPWLHTACAHCAFDWPRHVGGSSNNATRLFPFCTLNS